MKIRATGDNVVLKPREDLFSETDKETGIELVSLANSVTSVPDNMACCEVVSVGELVTNVKPGDLAFIDFFRVKQGYVVANDECYICGSDAFTALYDEKAQRILPLENFVITRPNKERYLVALTGSDRDVLLPMNYTDGFASGHSSKGTVAARTYYQEVVAIGKLTTRARPGVMTPTERWVLECLRSGDFMVNPLVEALQEERANGRAPDITIGQLVGFCKDIGQRVRVRGEYQWIVPYENCLAEVLDAEILEEAVRERRAGRLVLV